MTHLHSSNKRAFTYGNQLGYIQYGMFMPVHLDEERFKEVIDDILNYEEKCVTSDLVLQNAIKRYTGIYKFARIYEGMTNHASDFYNTWKEYILKLEKFKNINPIARENSQKKGAEVLKNRHREAFRNSCGVDSVLRVCAKTKW